MNWFGEMIQDHISHQDTVLDLGCGIMQATTDVLESKMPHMSRLLVWRRSVVRMLRGERVDLRRLVWRRKARVLQCKSLLGCDIWSQYLEVAKRYFPVVRIGMDELDRFVDASYDIVICIDVLEHLNLQSALQALEHMKRIARKKVIVYTPSSFKTNEESTHDAWDMGPNPHQMHQCVVPPETLKQLGFAISFPGPDKNTLGILVKAF